MSDKQVDEKGKKPGPDAERLKIDLNPNEALQRLLHAPPRRKNRAKKPAEDG